MSQGLIYFFLSLSMRDELWLCIYTLRAVLLLLMAVPGIYSGKTHCVNKRKLCEAFFEHLSSSRVRVRYSLTRVSTCLLHDLTGTFMRSARACVGDLEALEGRDPCAWCCILGLSLCKASMNI